LSVPVKRLVPDNSTLVGSLAGAPIPRFVGLWPFTGFRDFSLSNPVHLQDITAIK